MERCGNDADQVEPEEEWLRQNGLHKIKINCFLGEDRGDARLINMPCDENQRHDTCDPLQQEHQVTEISVSPCIVLACQYDVHTENGMIQDRYVDDYPFKHEPEWQVMHETGSRIEAAASVCSEVVDHQVLDKEDSDWKHSQQRMKPAVEKLSILVHTYPLSSSLN